MVDFIEQYVMCTVSSQSAKNCRLHQLAAVKRGTSLAPLPPTQHFCQALQYRLSLHCHVNSTIKHRAFFLATGR
tara:strand:- start:3743 stop:3964 length:222 start_codon:yes stop_codon:yes gene_type:complete